MIEAVVEETMMMQEPKERHATVNENDRTALGMSLLARTRVWVH